MVEEHGPDCKRPKSTELLCFTIEAWHQARSKLSSSAHVAEGQLLRSLSVVNLFHLNVYRRA
jgi:hypothetical protein